jgi:hypothetical protein
MKLGADNRPVIERIERIESWSQCAPPKHGDKTSHATWLTRFRAARATRCRHLRDVGHQSCTALVNGRAQVSRHFGTGKPLSP